MRRLVLCLASLLCVATSVRAGAGVDRVELVNQRPLMKDVDALPRLRSGAKPAVIKLINAALAQVDAEALAEARECLAEKGSEFDRSVSVTMQGPRFLSLFTNEGFFCAGAAHPDSNRLALVFDLSTGKSVDWQQLLPGKAQTKKFDADLEARLPSGSLISSDAIWALYKKSALLEDGNDSGCAGVFDEQLDLMLSLDAEKNAVAVDEAGLRRQVMACATTLYLTGDMLRSLGARRELIDALEAAHRGLSAGGRK